MDWFLCDRDVCHERVKKTFYHRQIFLPKKLSECKTKEKTEFHLVSTSPYSEAYSGTYQTSKMELFMKIVND